MLWKDRYRIETARKAGWDYSSAAWYFITVCENHRAPVFGQLHGEGETAFVELSPLGRCIARQWQLIPEAYPDVVLDASQVMPDHFHVLFWLDGTPLSRIMNRFKGRVTHQNNQSDYDSFQWQERFHDEIIQTQNRFDQVRGYILTNPQGKTP